MPSKTFKERGREFRFNDHVCIELLLGVPDAKRTGRLVQVRKGCGQFGSSVYLIRLRDGSLMSFENALIRHVGDGKFVDAFYRSNGVQPPEIPDQDVYHSDSEAATYSISGKWPETGFLIQKPSQPQTAGSFAVAVITMKSRTKRNL